MIRIPRGRRASASSVRRDRGHRVFPRFPPENYWFRRHEAAYRWAAGLVRGRVVDAGCGEGYGTAILARSGPATGLELDPAVAADARPRYPAARFLVADLCHPPIQGMDAVVALQVLEHLWCPAEFVAACARGLAAGGLLVVSTPNADTFPTGLNPAHTHEYTAEELSGLLRTVFREVELHGLGHGPALERLDRRLGGSVQRRLVETDYEDLPLGVRARLRAVRARHFRVSPNPGGSLDLLAVCRDPIPEGSG